MSTNEATRNWVINEMGGKISIPAGYQPQQYAAYSDAIDLRNVDAVQMFPGTPLSRVQAYLPMMVGYVLLLRVHLSGLSEGDR